MSSPNDPTLIQDGGDNSSSPSQSQSPSQVFSEEFKNAVREYCTKDDQCLTLKKQVKTLQSELKDLEEVIVKHMQDHKLPLFDTKDKGMFKSQTKKETKSLNKELILNALVKCGQLKDSTKANDVVDFIYSSRPTESKTVLVRQMK